MDSNGDNQLQVREFLTYMLRGLVQSEESMRRFSKRSTMHYAVCCFLTNIDLRLSQDDDHIALNDHELDDLLHEIRGILTSNDILKAQGVSAANAGRNFDGRRRGSGSGRGTQQRQKRRQRGGDTATLQDSFESDSSLQNSYTQDDATGEIIRIEQQEQWNQAPTYNLREARTPIEQRRDRMKHSFVEERRRNNHEHNLVRSKHAENTRKRLRERERIRVLQRFNPEAIRQIAEKTSDEVTKSRLLAIVGESMRRNGRGMSPQQQKALEELNKASQQGIGHRRIR